MNNTEFSSTLLALRQKTGLSQVRAARLAGVPRSTWQSWEAGVRTPPSYVQALIVRVCEKPLAEGDKDALETLTNDKQ